MQVHGRQPRLGSDVLKGDSSSPGLGLWEGCGTVGGQWDCGGAVVLGNHKLDIINFHIIYLVQ